MVEDACDLHEAREASIVLRAIAASNYSGPEYARLLEIVKKMYGNLLRVKSQVISKKYLFY